MYSLYYSEVRAILNRGNASYATPYEFKKTRFVQISRSKYINLSSWLAYFKWAHLLLMGLSLSQAVKVEGFEIRLLALGTAIFFLNNWWSLMLVQYTQKKALYERSIGLFHSTQPVK
jgi:hypothetical protein